MRPTQDITPGAILVLVSLIAGGCASGGARPSTSENLPMGSACSGQSYVEVKNDYETMVDVYAFPASGGARRYLGSVGPGTQRLSLPPEPMGHIVAEQGGRRLTGKAASRGTPGGIAFTRGCEPFR